MPKKQSPPAKKSVKKPAKAHTKKPAALFNVGDSMRKVRLPKVAFFFDESVMHIYALTNLRFESTVSGSCGCAKITGELVTSAAGQHFANSFTVDAGKAFQTLPMAVEALRLHQLRKERDAFVNNVSNYRLNNNRKIAYARQWPELVCATLIRRHLLDPDAEVPTPETLKVVHYRTAVNECYPEIVRAAASRRFPDVAYTDDDDAGDADNDY